MHFIIDCDDVLLDWQRGFRSWLFANHGMRPDPDGPSSWSLAEWLGVPESRCLDLITGFNESDAFGGLHAFPDAIEAIAALKRAGHRLTVLTSCSSNPAVVNRRRENLRRQFDYAIDRIICLDLGETKKDWLDVLRTGIWIEDNYRNAMMGLHAGNDTFMMRRRHNRADEPNSHPHIKWVDDWRPIVSLFS